MSEYTFDVSHMDLFYNEFQALKDINMKIKKNEITALIGPSGCGKSTFLKTLNRMNDWVEGCRVTGDIRFEGKDIFKEVDPLALRYRVGMVFQQPTPFPACCILCVTMTMVYFSFNSRARSSIFCVEIGSSADVGSSMRMTDGPAAKVRAMQRRCCWPPERPRALFWRRSFISSQQAA